MKGLKVPLIKKGNHLNHIISAEDNLYNFGSNANETLIENYKITDQIKYSTVTLYIYQNPVVLQEKVGNATAIVSYTPGFGKKYLHHYFRVGKCLKVLWCTL